MLRKRLISMAASGMLLAGLLGVSAAPVLGHQDHCPIGLFVVDECVIAGANNATGTQEFGHSVRMTDGSSINASGGGVTLDITGDFTMETVSTIEANDDIAPANASASAIAINVSGDMLMQAGTRILAENTNAGGNGGDITIDVDGSLTMGGASGATNGALISTRKTGGAGDTGLAGDIAITVGNDATGSGDFFMGGGSTAYGAETGARIDATGRGPSGDIDISVAGDFHGEPGSVVASGGLNGTAIQQGGKIFVVVGCVLLTEGRITSKGPNPGADLVHLEGCDVLIRGLVESTGKGHTVNANPAQPNVAPFNSCDGFSDASVQNEIVRDGKAAHATGCIEVWGNNITIDSTGGWAGELNADIGNGGPQGSSWIDVFAKSSLTVADGTGNDRISNNLGHTYFSTYAVHANSISGSDVRVGTVTALVEAGPLTATGKAFEASATLNDQTGHGSIDPFVGNGSTGGTIDLEAAGAITLDSAWVNASGDFFGGGSCPSGSGACGVGGHIVVRAWGAGSDISWTGGDGDVRPNATGDITLAACDAIDTTGTDFNGETPSSSTGGTNCDPAKPDIPTYVDFDEEAWALCGEEEPEPGTKSGTKYEDLDADGDRDGGEPGLEGWTIKVFNDVDDSDSLSAGDTLEATQDTVAGGGYSFSLDPGEYVVCEEAQGLAGTWFQSEPSNSICEFDAVDATLAPGGYAVTMTSDSTHTGNDFGNFREATKSGHKFNDLNNDGTWDGGEPGIAGWAIHLFGTSGAGVAVELTTTTNGDGLYTFTLDPGSYTVCEEDQLGWSQTFPIAGADCSGHTDGGAFTPAPLGYAIVLVSNELDEGNDFGNFQPQTGGGEGCTPGFWQGGVGADLWNSVGDTDWTDAGGTGTNPFIHTTLFNSYFTAHPALSGATVDEMLEIVGTGGGPVPAQKAARMLIAGYLNASFGLDYGYTPEELEAKWTAAVAGGDAALSALHQELGALNEQGCDIGNS